MATNQITVTLGRLCGPDDRFDVDDGTEADDLIKVAKDKVRQFAAPNFRNDDDPQGEDGVVQALRRSTHVLIWQDPSPGRGHQVDMALVAVYDIRSGKLVRLFEKGDT